MARCNQITQVATTTEPIKAASDREQLLAKIAELEAQVQKQKEEAVADSGPSIDLERILDNDGNIDTDLSVVFRDSIHGVTPQDVARLALRGGAESVSSGLTEEVRSIIMGNQEGLEGVLRNAVTQTEYRHDKSVTVSDVLEALKAKFGFGLKEA